MKNLFYLLIFTLLIACGGKTKKASTHTEPEVSNTPLQWLTFNKDSKKTKHIVMISGDEEYRSEEALPQLAKILSKHHGFKCTV